jgi:hypothetical protein
MSLFPTCEAILDGNLSDQDKQKALDTISSLKGVIGAHFNKAADVSITYRDPYPLPAGQERVENAVAKVAGVKEVRHTYHT